MTSELHGHTPEEHLAAGRAMGSSDWLRLPQDMLTLFEVLTKSNDKLHTDPEWVRRHTHYAGTIAPGFLTMSLLPFFAAQVALAPAGHVAVNYGFDRLRWPAPVPVDAAVRAHFVSGGTQPRPAGQPGFIARIEVTVDVQGQTKPALVATWLAAMIPDRLADRDGP
jgi:acyl dehydratase